MEVFELILVLLACVIASSILDQVASRVSIPLIQIGVGLAAALVAPQVAEVHMDSELFMVLFIAPLLFNEAREAGKRELWDSKGAIVSLAVGLVLATVLVVGFAVNLLVPSIPLAAAFALAAALGPTDAAAVGALGSVVNLNKRQHTLLSGESLINDASGVVCFEFAIAAALTGAFSVADAGATFAVLFFGGIVAGAVMGLAGSLSIVALRRRGFENTTVHVLYEVFTPFVVFLTAEALGTSGVLAVVAAGFFMSASAPRLVSADRARLEIVSESFWEILVYLINGVIFVLLGMQLPSAFSAQVTAVMHPAALFGLVVFIYVLVMLCRFAWIAVMELRHRDPETGMPGAEDVPRCLRESLVTTIAGAKGAVTLSIIFTIPSFMRDGAAFPNRTLIIFLAAGVILLSLVVADLALPRLAPAPAGVQGYEEKKRFATIAVLQGTISELEARIVRGDHPEFEPALRLAIARYRTRLNRERFAMEHLGDEMTQLVGEVLERQQARADEIQLHPGDEGYDPKAAAPYYAMLRGVRASVGYFAGAQNVGSRLQGLRGALYMLRQRLFPTQVDTEQTERIYYDTCLFAADLEHVAIDYLEGVAQGAGDSTRGRVARVLADEHQAALQSLWGRINYGQEQQMEDPGVYEHGEHDKMPADMRQTFGQQFAQARRYADEVDATALAIELEAIGLLRSHDEIDDRLARELREEVYLLQMQLGD